MKVAHEIKTIVYTTSKTRWMGRYEARIRKNYEKAKGVKAARFEYRHIKLETLPVRTYRDGDIKPAPSFITKTFTEPAAAQGFNNIFLNLSRADKKRFGIKGIAGTYNRDKVPDDVWECVIIADKGQMAKGYDNMPEYVRLAIHEPGHPAAIRQFGPNTDIVHLMDSGEGVTNGARQIEGLWALFDFTSNPTTMTKPIYPLPAAIYNSISQPFLTKSSHYKSGVHPGCDHRAPIGTRLCAPVDLEITKSGQNHVSLGGHVYVAFTIDGKRYWGRFLHLSKAMPAGRYQQGDLIGITGNTGDSTGPHLHDDLWRVPIDVSLIVTEKGVRAHLIDPHAFWRERVDGIVKK